MERDNMPFSCNFLPMPAVPFRFYNPNCVYQDIHKDKKEHTFKNRIKRKQIFINVFNLFLLSTKNACFILR